MPRTPVQIAEDAADLLWLDRINCVDEDPGVFFVEAGHVIDEKTLKLCRGCPVREECVVHAYQNKVIGGYFGGMSPGQRREMSLEEALEFVRADKGA